MIVRYELTVSYKGAHLFTTGPHDCQDEATMKWLLGILEQRFPKEEGFHISVTAVECTWKPVEGESLR